MPLLNRYILPDPAFFDLFNFPLVAGTNNITDRNAVLITEKTAKKYFGATGCNWQDVLTFYAGETYAMPLTVTGILKDVPVNSTLRFDFITQFRQPVKS